MCELFSQQIDLVLIVRLEKTFQIACQKDFDLYYKCDT